MFPEQCSAVLKTIGDHVLEIGTACVSIRNQTVDFVAPFVPLIPINQPAKIVCVENGLSTHVITGNTYLSSPKMLRLTDIRCVLLPGAEQVLNAQTPFPCKIQQSALVGRLLPGKLMCRWRECSVLSLSLSDIVLRCPRMEEDDAEHVRILLGAPVLETEKELLLTIGAPGILFGKHAKYNYHLPKLSSQIKAAISEYIRSDQIAMLGDTL